MNRNTIIIGAVVALAVGFAGFNLWGYFTSQQKARAERALVAQEQSFIAQQAAADRANEREKARAAEELRIQAEREERVRAQQAEQAAREARVAEATAEREANAERIRLERESANRKRARLIGRVEGWDEEMISSVRELSARFIRDHPEEFIGLTVPVNESRATYLRNKKLFREGSTPFMIIAAISRDTDVVQAMIDAGADIHKTNKLGFSVIHFASAYGSADTVELLLKNGASVKSKAYVLDMTPLHTAAALNPNPDVTRVLIKHGAELEAQTENEYTPLLIAAGSNKNLEIAEVLIDAGADTSAYTEEGAAVVTVLRHRMTGRGDEYIKISDEFNENLLSKASR